MRVASRARMQRRVTAVVALLALVIAGLLGMHHAAEVAHVQDLATGELVHAQALAERHEASATNHLHGRVAGDLDTGRCALVAAAHASVVLGSVATVHSAPPVVALGIPRFAPPRFARAGYRLAPKTSPPARA